MDFDEIRHDDNQPKQKLSFGIGKKVRSNAVVSIL